VAVAVAAVVAAAPVREEKGDIKRMKISKKFLSCSVVVWLSLWAVPGVAHLPEFPPDAPAPRPTLDTMPGFTWVVADQLAAMARPGRERDLDRDLAFLQSAGLTVLVSLTEEPIAPEMLAKYGITGLHLPVADFTPPSMAQIEQFLATFKKAQLEARPVGIHCTAGKGRTGTMLAAYLVSKGQSASEAIAKIRRLRPGSVETPEQEARIAEFAASLADQ